ncbi:MAG: peptidase S9, partial [Dysgonamonadaceae bacterium]|nr:peptidase S9 [Dysgonamonadaceae bacterium]
MKKLISFLMLATIFAACHSKKENPSGDVVIGKKPVEITDGRLSAEVLQLLGQVSGIAVSPDGKTVLYGVSYTDIALNKRNRELFTVQIDGTNKKQITQTPK